MYVTLEGVTSVNPIHVEVWKNSLPYLLDTVGPAVVAGDSFNSAFAVEIISTDVEVELRIYSAAATLANVRVLILSE